MRTVSAVILTYNRKALLSECLDAIAAQSRPVDRIVVVDNASTDGTPNWVSSEWGDKVELYVLPQNIGSAGGFSTLMRVGYECGDDDLWVMDDDVIPAPDALERLIAAQFALAEGDVIAPYLLSTARTRDGVLTDVPAIDLRRNHLSYPIWPLLLDKSVIPINRSTFVSMLLRRETLRQYGLPIAEMFMWGEDTEFTRRITREQPAYIVGNSHVVHLRSTAGVLDIRTETNPDRIRWHYFLRRNRMYLRRKSGRRAFVTQIRQQLKRSARLLLQGEFTKSKVVFSGVRDGVFYNPRMQTVDTPCDLESLRFRGHGRMVAGENARVS